MEETDFDRRKRLQDEVIAEIKDFSGSERLRRDEIHKRNALR